MHQLAIYKMALSYAFVNCGLSSYISGAKMTRSKRTALPPRTSVIRMASSTDAGDNLKLHSNVDPIMQPSCPGLYSMNGGEGPHSYAQNSMYQRGVVDVAKPILEEEIATNLDLKQHVTQGSNPKFFIADFGCSTGLNSFPAMEIITEAVEKQFRLISRIPDFQVFFNDQVRNDFNTVFNSLPPKRLYHAAGVPGPFHGRLLPNKTIHFAYSSCSLNWLSQVPGPVQDYNSPAWNKGNVHYIGARQQVFQEYSNQYANDIQSFLEARAQEVVTDGMMALLVPADPSFNRSSTTFTTPNELQLIGSCLVDMVNEGRISEEKVDSFNFPLYFTIPEELKAIIETNNKFTIERMEVLNNPGKSTMVGAVVRSSYLRATCEGLLRNHFGEEKMDELFNRYTNKLAASPLFLDPQNEKSIIIFVLLKRKV